MAEFQFNIDSVVYRDPLNWREIEAGIEFDGRDVSLTEIPAMDFCDSTLRAAIDTKPDCSFLPLIILSKKSDTGGFSNLVYGGYIPTRDITEECDTGKISIPTKKFGPGDRMKEIANREICVSADTYLSLFDIESGGYFRDVNGDEIKRRFVSLSELMVEMVEQSGASQTNPGIKLNSLLFLNYRQDEQVINMPTLSGGDVVVLTLAGSMGQTYTATVTAPGGGMSAADLATALEKCLNYYNPGGGSTISMNMIEFEQRLSSAEYTGGNTLTIRADWEIESIEATQNGVSFYSYTANGASFRMGIGNLYVSTKGLQGDQVCMNWSKAKDLIIALTNPVFSNLVENDINVHEYNEYFNGITSMTIDNAENVKLRLDQSWMVPTASFGYGFRHEKRIDSNDNWQFEEAITDIGDPFSLYTFEQTGNFELVGNAIIENTHPTNTVTFGVELHLDGAAIGSGIGGSLIPGQTQALDLPSFFSQAGLSNDQCYKKGQSTFQLVIITGGPDITPVAPHTTAAKEIYPFDIPFIDEDALYNIQNGVLLTDFADCNGYRNETVADDIYGGHGYAYHQAVKDGEYQNTFFLTYKANAEDKATRYEKRLYIPGGLLNFPTCLQDSTRSVYFYNAPISFVNIFQMWRQQIPSDIIVKSYDFASTMDTNGDITGTVTQSDKTLPALTDRRHIINFEACAGSPSPVSDILNSQVELDNVCGFSGVAIVRKLLFGLGTNRMNMEVLI